MHPLLGLLLLTGCSPANRADAPPTLALTHLTLIDVADPLASLANTRRIRYVVLGGVPYAPAEVLEGSGRAQRKDR
ncbi:MAG: hypothetical protein QOH59_1791 [Gemmatimonadales bacterium]|jgi:hypothetical protein|nr:hypothetical protein [Gemmatimonadales bacterium]